MRAYAAMLSARFRLLLQYRAAAVAGFGTQLFWGLIRMMILTAFYENAAAAATPMSLDHVVAYVWLGQAFLMLTILGADGDIQALIRSGNVAYELLRPVDLYGLWFSRILAARTAPLLLRAIPLLAIAFAAGWIHWPGLPQLAAFAACLVAAILLSAAMGTLMTISMFWTVSGIGLSRLTSTACYFLSGLVVPLPLFPDAWQGVLGFLPFRGLGDVPFRLFTGDLPAEALPGLLGHQLAWTVGLVIFTRWLLSRATRRLVVQGG